MAEHTGMNRMTTHSRPGTQIDILDHGVVIRLPNHPPIHVSLDIPNIRCAGYSPTYTRKGWLWCAYSNALMVGEMELGEKPSLELFHELWMRVDPSGRF